MAARSSAGKSAPAKVPEGEHGRQLTTQRDQMDNVRGLLEKYKPQMEMALPKHLNGERMLRLFMTCIANEPKLLQCTRASLVGSMMQLSQLGLEPGLLGQAYLLPFRNNRKNTMEAQIIPGYRGLLKLARNSGQISTVNARAVYGQDHFEYSFGLVDKLHHIPTDDPVTPADLRFAYAVVKLRDGGVQWEVMNRREVLEVKKGSRASDNGPWVTHEAEMWKKTVLRRICKLLPASVELQTAIALDEAVDIGLPQQFDVIDMDALEAEDAEQDQSNGEDLAGAEDGAEG